MEVDNDEDSGLGNLNTTMNASFTAAKIGSSTSPMTVEPDDVDMPSVTTPGVPPPPPVPTDGIIRKLDEVVINRIAAGEVVQRPANALKEMLENSLDAGAKNIQIVVKSGGLKLLQIQDDGSGIKKDDLTIVCQRFTTSKLECFEDLQRIQTYGFRGEALASISHVAHVTIITKTADSPCAYRAEYENGELKSAAPGSSNPKPCAGNVGTIIMVEDLFFNMDTRRRALKSAPEEHNKIMDLVTKYAVHNCRVGFSLKKFGETSNDVRVPPNSNHLDNIKMVYGVQIARELVPVSAEDSRTRFSMTGYVSNANYSVKKSSVLLFINNRLVDSVALRRSIDNLYSAFLPKGTHPFLYLSIKIDPQNVDVNVHPTKHEVHFLHEDMIISSIVNSIESVLLTTNKSRTFYCQSLLPNATSTATTTTTTGGRRVTKSDQPKGTQKKSLDDSSSSWTAQAQSSSYTTVAPKNMVRTDPKAQKLDRFFSVTKTPGVADISGIGMTGTIQNTPGAPGGNRDVGSIQNQNKNVERTGAGGGGDEDIVIEQHTRRKPASSSKVMSQQSNSESMKTPASQSSLTSSGHKREIRLRSVKNLRKKVEDDCHNGLLEVFRNHIFVGCADRTLALIQHETKLLMTNTVRLTAELFYQKMLKEFGNFGLITFDDPLYIRELVRALFETTPPGQIIDGLTEEDMRNGKKVEDEIHRLLTSKSKMLDDYFSMKIDAEGRLCSIPMLLENYFPVLEGIPQYLISLARKVDWTAEQECFESFCHQTAIFYAVPPGTMAENDEITQNTHSWKWTIEHVLYPEIKKSLLPPKAFAQDSTVVQLANLPDLYKVFERC